MTIQEKIQNAKTYLGIEFGSTRIKAVLIDDTFAPIASGSHEWQNRYENGVWTYSLDDITTGLQHCYAALTEDIRQKFGVTPTTYGAMGISGMMHGYMAFDKDDNLLVPFRTWRNTITEQAASELSELLSFNIPQRWSIAHLYQAILNGEEHVKHIAHINTLAGYIHYRLTGKRQVGIGEASGIFPVDSTGYNADYIKKVDELLSAKGFSVKLTEVLPSVLNAGAKEAFLTADGAKLLDPTGTLQPGIPLCPPEGDAGTITEQAASELSELLSFNIPQRWSIAHLYQAILNGEEHVKHIAHINTLAGYIHYRLTGKRQVGIGEASGIFPVDSTGYNADYIKKVDELLSAKGFSVKLTEVLPSVLNAGAKEAFLTADGAKLLDPTGTLQPGIPLCPPEGDAGTGMTATDSVLPRTGNVSAGTSIFAMLVLDKPLKGYYPEIDVVTTPCGAPVAMVHCNNCSSELDAWVKIFGEFAQLSGHPIAKPALYDMLYYHALTGDPDCGNTVVYNFLSGEPVAGAENGRPMYFRTPDGKFNLANLFRAEIYSTMAALKLGMDILFEKEQVSVEKITGHGGLFKTKGVAQQFLADGLGCAVSVMKTAGEGGAWGMALLAAYTVCGGGKSLSEFLDSEVFVGMKSTTLQPEKNGAEGFAGFMENYKRGLAAQYAAAK